MGMKRTLLIFFCAALLFCFNGCYDSVEINDILIVTGIGFDTVRDEPDKTNYTFQIGRVQKQESDSSGGNEASLTLDATSESFLGIVSDFREANSRRLFLSHNQTIIFGRDQANKGVQEYFDAMLREREIRIETHVIVADQTAADILEAEIAPEQLSGIVINKVMKNRMMTSPKLTLTMLEFVSLSRCETSAPLAPICKIETKGDQSKLTFDTMAVFKDYRMIGELNAEEVDGFIWSMGGIQYEELKVKMDDGLAVLTPYSHRWHAEPTIGENGSLQVLISLTANMVVKELLGFSEKTLKEVLLETERASSERIGELIKNCFQKAGELNADIFGFGSAFNRKYPKEWQGLKERWDELFPQIKLETDVKVTIRDTGEIAHSTQMKEG